MKNTTKILILCFVISVSVSSKANAHDVFPNHDGMHSDPPPPPMAPMSGGSDDDMHSHGMPSSSGMTMMHMTFFWGKNTQVLFSGWPGNQSGMYALALILVFLLAVSVEWLSRWRLMTEMGPRNFAAGIVQTAVHGVRIGIAYMVMLALMSFNGGVFIAAIAGHSFGFLIFGSRVLNNTKSKPYDQGTADLPSGVC
ncbi:copper transporter 6-like [Cucurbita pepo subsp. pepo]|uniref:copper transporter 6-like n=1 Tax=Cucurbita pepo subsp. pepo TaxID=3664 RepID=UPI000C9D6602|nr:copper transporter 6-like [Cucurbita pepo subsp. pepo]